MDTLTVLDTDVFVDHFRGLAAATAYIQGLRVAQRATTDVTVMELYKGAVNREQLTTMPAGVSRHTAACGFPPPRLQSRPWSWHS
jgi:predicted nucleic acid-binding protein